MNSSNSWQQCKRIIAIMMTITLVIGCGKEAEEDSSSSSSTSSGSNPALGVVQEDAFYVRLFDEGKYPFYMSKLGDFNTKCSIAKGTSGQALDCVLDVNELDLYFHGLSFQYNVPSGMCNYVVQSTYWYYNYEVGYGPETFVRNETRDASGNLTGSSCSIDGTVYTSCVGPDSSFGTSGPECVYNHTAEEGPNCCFGKYTYTLSTTTPSGSTSATTKLGWGGNMKDCIGGAAKTSWDHFSKDGWPRVLYYFTPTTGLNLRYDVKAPIQDAPNTGSNFPIANYYTASKHTHSGYVLTRSSSVPYIIDPIDDRSGTGFDSASPAYTWSCLDRNDEVVNRIRVYVREWNTNKEFVKYGTSGGTSGNPDIVGFEGVNCDYSSSISGDCNDSDDLDDLAPATYTPASKSAMFPEEKYQ